MDHNHGNDVRDLDLDWVIAILETLANEDGLRVEEEEDDTPIVQTFNLL